MFRARVVSVESIDLSECRKEKFELNPEETEKLTLQQKIKYFSRKIFRVVQQSEKEPWGKCFFTF
jgi:hypothetical protein